MLQHYNIFWPFLSSQHDYTSVHKEMSIQTWMSENGMKELDRPNLIEHILVEIESRQHSSNVKV